MGWRNFSTTDASNSTTTASSAPCGRSVFRKNSLFAGSDEGGENWACLASLIETCKLNRVNPQAYFTDLLTRLVNGWPQKRIDELMPWHWAPERPPDPSNFEGWWGTAYVWRIRRQLCPITKLLLQAGIGYDLSPVTGNNRTTRIPDANRFLLRGDHLQSVDQC